MRPTNRALVLLIILLVALLAILVDLLTGSVKQAELTSVTLDVSQPLPRAALEVQFAYGSRLSTVKPLAARCLLPSGEIHIQVQPIDDTSFFLYATCPVSDVESHAELLWDVMVTKHASTTSIFGDDFTCFVDVWVHIGHILPYTHTVELSSDDLAGSRVGGSSDENEEFLDKDD